MEFIVGIKLHHAASSSLDFFQKRNRKHFISWVLFVLTKCIELYVWIQSQLLDDEYCLLISSDTFGKHVQQNRKINVENELGVKTELSGSHKWLQTENNSGRHLRQFPRLLLFSPSNPVKASFKGNCRKVIHFKLWTRRLIWLWNTLCGGGGYRPTPP